MGPMPPGEASAHERPASSRKQEAIKFGWLAILSAARHRRNRAATRSARLRHGRNYQIDFLFAEIRMHGQTDHALADRLGYGETSFFQLKVLKNRLQVDRGRIMHGSWNARCLKRLLDFIAVRNLNRVLGPGGDVVRCHVRGFRNALQGLRISTRNSLASLELLVKNL